MPAVRPVPVNAAFLDEDMRLWNEYKRVPSPDNLGKLRVKAFNFGSLILRTYQEFPHLSDIIHGYKPRKINRTAADAGIFNSLNAAC